MIDVRAARRDDADALWAILKPVIRAGETYPLPRDMTRDAALDYWLAPAHSTHVAREGAAPLGTYYLRPNNVGGGAHVANCGYMVARGAEGRGVARAMCAHSLREARAKGFRAMQFSFVVSTNARAVALWGRMGFATLCRLPGVFNHPALGFVDALVMFRALDDIGATGSAT